MVTRKQLIKVIVTTAILVIVMGMIGMMLGLTGCSSGAGDGNSSEDGASPWTAVVPIQPDDVGYVWLTASINGKEETCLFDTGAPGMWVRTYMAEPYSTPDLIIGNWSSSDVTVWEMNLDLEWVHCLIGLPVFGMSQYQIDLNSNELVMR